MFVTGTPSATDISALRSSKASNSTSMARRAQPLRDQNPEPGLVFGKRGDENGLCGCGHGSIGRVRSRCSRAASPSSRNARVLP